MTPATGLRPARRARVARGPLAARGRGLLRRSAPGRRPAQPTESPASLRRWVALVVLCVGQLMIVLDATVVNVALPSIQHDLRITQTDLAWVINGYLVSFGGLLMLAGRLGDLVGRRRLFLGGVALFTAASVACGLAPSETALVGARFVQGIGAAVVSSMVLGILVTLFSDRRDTARAMSVYAFVAAAGGSIGLLVGGTLTQAVGWHWIFFINAPIGLAALVLGAILLPRAAGAGFRQGLDPAGAILITAAPSVAVFAILEAGGGSTPAPVVAGLAATAVILGAAFVAVEARVAHPLVPLRLFASRNVAGAGVVRTLFPVGLFGSFFLGALYLQHVLGLSAATTGLAFMPMNLCVALFSLVLTRRLVERFGAKATVVSGLLLATAGLLLFSRAPVHATYAFDVLPALLFMGVGAGLVFMPTVALAMSGVEASQAGLASGVANTALQIGAALGVAVIAMVSSGRTQSLLAHGSGPAAALAGGFRAGYLVAAGCMLLATVAAATVLQSRHPRRQAGAAAVSAVAAD